tara:strand:+ start:289 stop:519 length:231 start_codon:yes stop_codon:yes gene_type:complete
MIKEFLEYRRSLKSHTIDITPEMQRKLDAFDSSITTVLYNKTLDRLGKEMLGGELSPDYIRGAKFALIHFKKHFKN